MKRTSMTNGHVAAFFSLAIFCWYQPLAGVAFGATSEPPPQGQSEQEELEEAFPVEALTLSEFVGEEHRTLAIELAQRVVPPAWQIVENNGYLLPESEDAEAGKRSAAVFALQSETPPVAPMTSGVLIGLNDAGVPSTAMGFSGIELNDGYSVAIILDSDEFCGFQVAIDAKADLDGEIVGMNLAVLDDQDSDCDDDLTDEEKEALKDCIEACLDNAGITIGGVAMGCLITAIVLAIATGGIGTAGVIACLIAAGVSGLALWGLARCIGRCI